MPDPGYLPRERRAVDGRVLYMSALSVVLGVASALVAQALTRLIGLVTNLAFFGRFSTEFTSPAGNHLGLWVLVIPVLGGLVVGAMARYGSEAIRGHGIPEAMENVLLNKSRIPARVTLLKPISAAIAIGTGGPFGAEGPIIATGGALGSLLGQVLKTSAAERKTLLAAGAAGGMAATFGCPISAVLLAVELLLFELKPRSVIPVSLASAAAAAVRVAFLGPAPVFPMPDLAPIGLSATAIYLALGAAVGIFAAFVTRAVYAVEDSFEKLPLHFMWWPALGAVAVGVIGYLAPRTLGVGYDNIVGILTQAPGDADFAIGAIAMLCLLKLTSWLISLGSGTSGGTLAPLFTVGGAAGAVAGFLIARAFPALGVDPRMAALVGMASMFAGASRAFLASVVFAYETTRQPHGLLALLAGCSAAYAVSFLLLKESIMTEKIARRGVRVIGEYSADFLDQVLAKEVAARPVVSLTASQPVTEVNGWIASGAPGSSHQGWPVVDGVGRLLGVVTRRDLASGDGKLVGELVKRPAVVVLEESSLREAADIMTLQQVGRVPVVMAGDTRRAVGILTRSDLLRAHGKRLDGERAELSLDLRAKLAEGWRAR